MHPKTFQQRLHELNALCRSEKTLFLSVKQQKSLKNGSFFKDFFLAAFSPRIVVCPPGIEPGTYSVGGCHSIQLRYGHVDILFCVLAKSIIADFLKKRKRFFAHLKIFFA